VFERLVKQRLLLPLFALCAVLLTPALASAAVTELSDLKGAVPGCPGFEAKDCRIVVVRQTAFQAKVGETKAITTVPQAGNIVAWTLPVLDVAAAQVKKLSTSYGGAPQVALVVLTPLGKSQFKIAGKSPLMDVSPYLGTTPTFALPTALPVKKGQVIGITVPTWAPILQLGLGGDTSWRSTRPLSDVSQEDFTKQRALLGSVTQGSFAALYQRARLTYSATFIPNPTKAKSSTTTTSKTTK
jgi:hypothetical protein